MLCAEREGPRGVQGINRAMSQHFRQSLAHPADPGNRSEWYPGRPVMVLRNDYVLKLFNGDTGLVLPDASGVLMVWFPESDGGFRAVAPVRLPSHETAFATTVHKAQGSEFENVLLLLPSQPIRVVTRELLYTAVTRASRCATIVCGENVLVKAIASPTRRHSGLIDRLAAYHPSR
jgi:exodeoxyribonuclease V alpha subunit